MTIYTSNFLNSKTLATGHLVAPANHRAIGPKQGEGLAQTTADELGHPAKRMDNVFVYIYIYIYTYIYIISI